jgi:hypothetical protein
LRLRSGQVSPGPFSSSSSADTYGYNTFLELVSMNANR